MLTIGSAVWYRRLSYRITKIGKIAETETIVYFIEPTIGFHVENGLWVLEKDLTHNPFLPEAGG